jgi:hypothetical protein
VLRDRLAAGACKMVAMQPEIWFDYERGTVTIRETAPGLFVVSWYPSRPDDPTWPGSLVAADQFRDFPVDAAVRSHRAELERWLDDQADQPWYHPA